MKKSIITIAAAAMLSIGLVQTVAAEGKPDMTQKQIFSTTNEMATSSGGWVFPLLLLVLVAASVASAE